MRERCGALEAAMLQARETYDEERKSMQAMQEMYEQRFDVMEAKMRVL